MLQFLRNFIYKQLQSHIRNRQTPDLDWNRTSGVLEDIDPNRPIIQNSAPTTLQRKNKPMDRKIAWLAFFILVAWVLCLLMLHFWSPEMLIKSALYHSIIAKIEMCRMHVFFQFIAQIFTAGQTQCHWIWNLFSATHPQHLSDNFNTLLTCSNLIVLRWHY